jgi:hypothetical protein
MLNLEILSPRLYRGSTLFRQRLARGFPSVDATFEIIYLKKYEAELISPEEVAKWEQGASNAGYHYLGCAKTFALIGKAFAEANLEMMKGKTEIRSAGVTLRRSCLFLSQARSQERGH